MLSVTVVCRTLQHSCVGIRTILRTRSYMIWFLGISPSHLLSLSSSIIPMQWDLPSFSFLIITAMLKTSKDLCSPPLSGMSFLKILKQLTPSRLHISVQTSPYRGLPWMHYLKQHSHHFLFVYPTLFSSSYYLIIKNIIYFFIACFSHKNVLLLFTQCSIAHSQ